MFTGYNLLAFILLKENIVIRPNGRAECAINLSLLLFWLEILL